VNANDAAQLASDLKVVPGSQDKVAVARVKPGISPPGAGVAIYDSGVPLPNVSPGHSQSPASLAFGSSASVLYGGTYDYGIRTLSVDSSGVTDVTTDPRYSGADIKFENGLIFTSTGKVVDAASNQLRGTCPNVNTPAFVPVTESNRMLIAQRSTTVFQNVVIKACDLTTFLEIGSLTIPNVGSDFVTTSLVRYGTNGLALRTSNDQQRACQISQKLSCSQYAGSCLRVRGRLCSLSRKSGRKKSSKPKRKF